MAIITTEVKTGLLVTVNRITWKRSWSRFYKVV